MTEDGGDRGGEEGYRRERKRVKAGKREEGGMGEERGGKGCIMNCYLLHQDVIDALRFTACLPLPSNSLCLLLNTSVELCDAGEVESCSE